MKGDERIQNARLEILKLADSCPTLEQLLKGIHSLLIKKLDASNMYVTLINRETDSMEFVYCQDEITAACPVISNISDPKNKRLSTQVVKKNKILVFTRRELESGRDSGELELHGVLPEIWVGVPLQIQGSPIGALVIQDYENKKTYRPEDMELLIACSEQAAIAIERKRYQDLAQAAEDLFSYMPTGLFIYQFEPPDKLYFLQANPKATKLTGISTGEHWMKEFDELWPNAGALGIKEKFLRSALTGATYESEDTLYKDDRFSGAFKTKVFTIPGNRIVVAFEDILDKIMAEKARTESEHKFSKMFKFSPLPACLTDLETKIFLEANNAFLKTFGYKKEDLAKKTSLDIGLWHNKDKRKAFSDLLKAGGKVRDFMVTFRKADGAFWYGQLSAVLVFINDRTYILSFFVDITDKIKARRELSVAKDRLQSLYNLNQMMDKSSQDITQHALEEAARLTGSDCGYFHIFDEDISAFDLTTWTNNMNALCTASHYNPYPLKVCGIWADSIRTRRPVIHNDYKNAPFAKGLPPGHIEITRHLGIPVIMDGKVMAAMGVGNKKSPYDEFDVLQLQLFTDGLWKIIQRKQWQENLIASQKASEQANMAKSEFLANMSHEIRTPLNGVMGMLQLMASTESKEELKNYCDVALASCRRLTNLLSDILDLSKIEHGKISIVKEPFNLKALMTSVAEIFETTVSGKDLDLLVDYPANIPDKLVGDEMRLRQILFNLVGNAVKFTPKGQVKVQATLAGETKDTARVLFMVSDTGIGMKDEDLRRIFAPFSQVETNYSRQFQGAGLGLNIVNRLVELMDGNMSVETEQDKGTTFYVTFPLEKQKDSAKPPRCTVPDKGIKTRPLALVAEDDDISLVTMKRFLEKNGFEVKTAINGLALLKLIKRTKPAIVFLDIRMPVMSGLEAAKRIRNEPEFKDKAHIPLIAVTAYAMKGDMESFLQAGMDDYLAKPLEAHELKRLLAKHC